MRDCVGVRGDAGIWDCHADPHVCAGACSARYNDPLALRRPRESYGCVHVRSGSDADFAGSVDGADDDDDRANDCDTDASSTDDVP